MPDAPQDQEYNQPQEEVQQSEGDYSALIERIVREELERRDAQLHAYFEFYLGQELDGVKERIFNDLRIIGDKDIDVKGERARWTVAYKPPVQGS